MPEPIAAGDTFVVTAGCDKRFATCRDRFDNVVNFRGFPHIPGNDFVMRYAVPGEPGNDGGSLLVIPPRDARSVAHAIDAFTRVWTATLASTLAGRGMDMEIP